jgi:osmotically-inducible protein OsmY
MAPNDLIAAVKAALEQDPDINVHRFPVRVTWDGRQDALSLEGTVEDIAALRKALHIARRLADFGAVTDDLHVQTGTEATGDELRATVIRLLATEPVFAGTMIIDARREQAPPREGEHWIRVDVSGSSVDLEGNMGSLTHRRLAEVLAWWAPGASRVRNRIVVRPPERESDDELTDAIRMVLEKDPSVDASQVHVRVKEGAVTLEGAVRAEANREIASRDCWYIPGVHAVDNRLRVVD